MNEIKKDIESLLDDFNLDEFSSHFSNENDFKYLVKNLTNYVKFKINENKWTIEKWNNEPIHIKYE